MNLLFNMLMTNQATLLFVRTMFVVMLMLDCLMCVIGVRLEESPDYLDCIANLYSCTRLYAARPSPSGVCEGESEGTTFL
jgi:hypothetical protein